MRGTTLDPDTIRPTLQTEHHQKERPGRHRPGPFVPSTQSAAAYYLPAGGGQPLSGFSWDTVLSPVFHRYWLRRRFKSLVNFITSFHARDYHMERQASNNSLNLTVRPAGYAER